MSESFLLSWLAVMFPLVISPGPANIIFAASGAKFGVKQSLPLMFGVDFVLVVKSIVIGFGVGILLQNNPIILDSLQILGSLYLFYIAYGFFKQVIKEQNLEDKKLGFIDGMIIQFFNVKGWMLIILMFSLFSTRMTIENETMSVLTLVVMLSLLNMTAHIIWISLSSYIVKTFYKNQSQKLQNLLFSISLVVVGFWFLWDNRIVNSLF